MSDYKYSVGSFIKSGTTGNQIVPVRTNFPIKSVIFWSTCQSTEGIDATGRFILGFTDGSQNRVTSVYNPDDFLGSISTPQSPRAFMHDLFCIAANDSSATGVTDAAHIVSLGSGSFTINWSTNSGSDWTIHYLAIGGTDTKCQIVTVLNPVSDGNQVINTIGLGQITAVMAMNVITTEGHGDTANWCNLPNVGFTSNANSVSYAGHSGNYPVIAEALLYQLFFKFILGLAGGIGSPPESYEAALISLGSDTFTVDWEATPGLGPFGNASTFYLVISGPQVTVGSLSQPLVNGDVDTTLTFNPGALMMMSAGFLANSGPIIKENQLSFGAFDGFKYGLSWFSYIGDVNPSISSRESESDKIIVCNTPISANGIVRNDSYATAALSVNKFTLNWQLSGPQSPLAREILYVAFEGVPSSAQGTIVVGKASVLVNSDIFTIDSPNLSPTSFTIGFDGTQEFTVLPGTYTIFESGSPKYIPSYNISNDPVNNDNLNIVVNDTDVIDVVIVNTLQTKYGGLYIFDPQSTKTNDTLIDQDGNMINKIINWFWQLFIARDK